MPERYRISIYLDVFRDGLRIGEVCALQRRDIDPGTSILHIRRGRGTMDNERLTDTPKTDNSIRGERILLELLPLLQQFLDEQVRTKKVACLSRNGKAPPNPSTRIYHAPGTHRLGTRPAALTSVFIN